jgi:hypothetical protein
MKNQQDTQHLKCILTAAEQAAHALQMAKAHQELTDLEAQKKSAMKQFDSKIETQKALVHRESTLVSQGYEYRDVKGFWLLNTPVKGMKQFVREDPVAATPADYIPDTQPMTSEDTQAVITFEKEERK